MLSPLARTARPPFRGLGKASQPAFTGSAVNRCSILGAEPQPSASLANFQIYARINHNSPGRHSRPRHRLHLFSRGIWKGPPLGKRPPAAVPFLSRQSLQARRSKGNTVLSSPLENLSPMAAPSPARPEVNSRAVRAMLRNPRRQGGFFSWRKCFRLYYRGRGASIASMRAARLLVPATL